MRWAGTRWTMAVGLTLLVSAAPGWAQVRGAPNRNLAAQRRQVQAPRNFAKEFRDLAEQLGRKFDAKVLVETTIFVPTAPKAPQDASNIEAGLGGLVSQVKGLSWRRVYLPKMVASAGVSPDKLAAALRAMESVEQSGIVAVNPSTRRASSLVKEFPVGQQFTEDLEAQQYSTTPVYVVYAAPGAGDASGLPAQERMLDLQRQQMQLMLQMSPEQMAEAVNQGMQMYLSLDPQVRQQMMGGMMRAGMQMFMNMPPEQRQQLIQEIMGNMQGMFGPGGPGGPPGR